MLIAVNAIVSTTANLAPLGWHFLVPSLYWKLLLEEENPMGILLEQLIQNIADSGLMSGQEVRTFLESLPEDNRPQDGESLARELTASGKLTPYQAEALSSGETSGLVFDQYIVLEKIGQGGMGVVLKARHRTMHSLRAVKRLSAEAMAVPERVQRFYREVRAAARLHHPNIVTAHDAREQDGVHYLIMEFVDGQDLASIVRKEGPLPVERAVDYIIQAAQGLSYAHKHGIVHRDIKPSNLLISGEGTVKVLDMGLARIDEAGDSGDAPTQEHLTTDGQIMGTCDYMAPEQAEHTSAADHRSDIYSLGCTFYRLLTGDLPYSASSNVLVLLAHREKEIPSLSEKRRDVPPEIETVYHRMMAKLPEDRCQSMQEVVDALEAARRGEVPADSAVDVIAGDEKLSSFLEHIRDEPSSVSGIGKRPGVSGIGKRGGRRTRKAAAPTVESAPKTADETADGVAKEDTESSAVEREVVATAKPAPATRRRGPRQRRKNPTALWIGIAAVISLLGVAAVALVVYTQTSFGTVVVDTEQKNVQILVTRGGETVEIIDGQDAWRVELRPGDYDVELKDGGDSLELDQQTIAVARGDEVRLKVRKRVAREADAGIAVPTGQWVDLLLLIDTKEDVRSGTWNLDEGCLSSLWGQEQDFNAPALIRLPVRVSGSYELRIVGDRLRGDRVFLPSEAGHGRCSFDGTGAWLHGRDSGFDKTLYSSNTVVLDEGQRLNISMLTMADHAAISAYSDDISFIDWKGPVQELSILANDPAAAGYVLLATDGSPVRYRQIQMRVVEGTAHLLRPAAEATAEKDDNYALEFDGWCSWVRTPVVYRGSHPLTVEAWVETRSDASTVQNIVADYGGGSCFALHLDKDYFFRFFLSRGFDDINSVPSQWTSLPGRPYHIAAVYDGSSIGLYVNGRQQGLIAQESVGTNVFNAPLMIGTTPQSREDLASGKECFTGLIDEVRFSSVARYDKDFKPPQRLEPDEQTIALYHFDEGEGGVARDASGHGRHGTLVGAKWVRVGTSFPGRANLALPPGEPGPLPNGWRITEVTSLGPNVNAPSADFAPVLSEDGLLLVYHSDRSGGEGKKDLWKCTRMSLTEPFDKAVNLGPTVNSGADDVCPNLSADGLTVAFRSQRAQKPAGSNFWMCRRPSRGDPFGEAVNVGAPGGSSGPMQDYTSSPDGLTLVFTSNRPSGEGGHDLWMCTRQSSGESFGEPVNLGPQINSSWHEGAPALSADGLTLLFDSDRRGGMGRSDLWMCTRSSTSEPFGTPVNLGPGVNTAGFDGSPFLSPDGRTLLFCSDRPGGKGKSDIYQAVIVPK
jgi:serine/threonine protein kinase